MPTKKINFFKKYQQEIVAVAVLFLFASLIFSVFFLLGSPEKIVPVDHPLSVNKEEKNDLSAPTSSDIFYDSYPVAVMIDNFYSVRPQAGLSQASFIYETLVEGGATRFMAVFNNNQDVKAIGPVRSARPYFVDWALEYNALYVHAGGSPEALDDIYNWQVNDMNEISGYGTTYFYRDHSLPAPHNLFTDSERLKKGLSEWGLENIDYTKWQVASSAVNDFGNDGQEIYVDFSEGVGYDAAFVYSSSTNQYIRQDVDEPLVDVNGGEVVAADNVIIQFIPGEELSGGKGRLDLDIYGKGDALFFQNGEVEEIYWQKNVRGERTKFKGEGGLEVKLNPGLTWIVVVPGDREVSYQ